MSSVGGEMDGKLRIATHALMWYIYVPYVDNSESTQKIYGLDLKRGNGRLGKLAIDTLDSLLMKKMAADSKAKGKKMYTHTTCVEGCKSFILTELLNSANCCGIGCDSSSDGRNYFNLAKVNTVHCMFTATLSLLQCVDNWIVLFI